MSETDAFISNATAKTEAKPERTISTACEPANVAPVVVPSVPGRCRLQKRAKLSIPARLRPADPEPGKDFDETLITQNVSRDGLYLGSARQAYREGMLLQVTFPSLAEEPSRNGEYEGQVVRVDRPENAPVAVAVKLLAPKNKPA